LPAASARKSLGSISAKNYQNQNRLMFVEVIASQRCDFFDPQRSFVTGSEQLIFVQSDANKRANVS